MAPDYEYEKELIFNNVNAYMYNGNQDCGCFLGLLLLDFVDGTIRMDHHGCWRRISCSAANFRVWELNESKIHLVPNLILNHVYAKLSSFYELFPLHYMHSLLWC